MRPRDILLAVAVAAAWGFNFVAIEAGLDRMPPLLFCALRFGLAAVPALFFVGRPQVAWRWVIAVGLILGVVKFSLLFAGMAAGLPAGLSSLVLQSQAIFTTVFAVALLRERPALRQWAGLGVALLGVALVAGRLGTDRPVEGFLLVLAAAVAWGLSNIVMRKAAPPSVLRFMVWVSAVATLPLLGLSLLFEGPDRIAPALRALDLTGLGALAYIAGISTLAGFAGWGALISRYGAATVAPFSMLVPFFGMSSAALWLGEPLHATDLVAGVLVVGGVLLGAARRSHQPVPRPGAVGPPAACQVASTA
ncbi:membrane protein [Catellatospora sp. TT07R-123]|uniref:EamA family transporter n=1 Tax=Catellatospora sp. TT07R-123 TaxID=2733863 RepID=UPI001B08E6FC|nr:EamA family transporter [Catellatospora sp. TT07R-123]GHJ44919.1 membrane protein [Catellatospora sp. TT07R-123]